MSWTPADLVNALHRLNAAGVRDVPTDFAGALRLAPVWREHPQIVDLDGEALVRAVDVWIAAQSSPKGLRMPTPAMLSAAMADRTRASRRQEEAKHGGQVPDAVKVARGQFAGWVSRVFGRERVQGGRRWREYITACDYPGHNQEIPPRFVAMGYTIELPVPANRSPDKVGLDWRNAFERDYSDFGKPHVSIQAAKVRHDGAQR